MENLDHSALDESSFVRNTEINDYLLESAKWGRFLAIIGYISLGLLVLGGIFIMTKGSEISSALPGAQFSMGGLGFVYIIMAVLFYFPVTYLFRFANEIKSGLNSEDEATITSGFSNLKSLFKFYGIFTVIMLAFYGLVILLAILAGLG